MKVVNKILLPNGQISQIILQTILLNISFIKNSFNVNFYNIPNWKEHKISKLSRTKSKYLEREWTL